MSQGGSYFLESQASLDLGSESACTSGTEGVDGSYESSFIDDGDVGVPVDRVAYRSVDDELQRNYAAGFAGGHSVPSSSDGDWSDPEYRRTIGREFYGRLYARGHYGRDGDASGSAGGHCSASGRVPGCAAGGGPSEPVCAVAASSQFRPWRSYECLGDVSGGDVAASAHALSRSAWLGDVRPDARRGGSPFGFHSSDDTLSSGGAVRLSDAPISVRLSGEVDYSDDGVSAGLSRGVRSSGREGRRRLASPVHRGGASSSSDGRVSLDGSQQQAAAVRESLDDGGHRPHGDVRVGGGAARDLAGASGVRDVWYSDSYSVDDCVPHVAAVRVGDQLVPYAGHSYWRERVGAPFVFRGKQVMLTVSRCDVSPNEVFANCCLLPSVEDVMVAKEHHADGMLHLHVYLSFKSNRSVADAQLHYGALFGFDHEDPVRPYLPSLRLVGELRGEARGRAKETWVKYLSKEGCWLANFDVHGFLASLDEPSESSVAKKRRTDEVYRLLTEGASIGDLLRTEHAAFVAFQLEKVKGAMNVVRVTQMAEKRLKWPDADDHPLFEGFRRLLADPSVFPADGWDVAFLVLSWIVENIRRPRQPGTPQLMISGTTSNQKTSLIEELGRWVSLGRWSTPRNKNDIAYQDFEDDVELVMVDEFDSATFNVTQMLRLCSDARGEAVRRFQRPALRFEFPVPIVMLTMEPSFAASLPPCSTEQYEALVRRVSFVRIPSGRDFFLPVVKWMAFCARHSGVPPPQHKFAQDFVLDCPAACAGILSVPTPVGAPSTVSRLTVLNPHR